MWSSVLDGYETTRIPSFVLTKSTETTIKTEVRVAIVITTYFFRGMPTSQIIWAFHSDAENELLSAIPCCQKGQETWDSLKAYGVAWWLKNNTTLRLIMEKVAKASFQANQDPMDAALFYLAMRKKNVLTHLFKVILKVVLLKYNLDC